MAAKTLAAKKRKIVQENRVFNDELKSRFAAVGHADFWRKHILLTKRFPGLVDNTMRTVAAFGCTYCCEQLFSRMKLTK